MEVPSFKENHIIQILALQMLQKPGWTYLSSADADRLRGGEMSNVLLEDIPRKRPSLKSCKQQIKRSLCSKPKPKSSENRKKA